MKSRQTKQEAAASTKGKVRIKNLKLTKETIEKLSDADAATIKGGAGGPIKAGKTSFDACAGTQ